MEKILSGVIGIWSFLGANVFSSDAPFLTIHTPTDLPVQKVIEESLSQEVNFTIQNESKQTPATIDNIVFQLKTNTQEILQSYRLESMANSDIDLGLTIFSKAGFATLRLNYEIPPQETLELALKLHIPPVNDINHVELVITKIEAAYTSEEGLASLHVFHNFQTISLGNSLPIQIIQVVEKPKLVLTDGEPISVNTLDPSLTNYALLHINLEASDENLIEGLHIKNNAHNENQIFEEYVHFKLFDHNEKQIAKAKMKEGKLFFDMKDNFASLPKGQLVTWTVKAQVPYFINTVYAKIKLAVDTTEANNGLSALHPSGGSLEIVGNANNGAEHLIPLLTDAPQDRYPDLLIKEVTFTKGETSADQSQFKTTICNEGLDLASTEEKPSTIIIDLMSEFFIKSKEIISNTPFFHEECTDITFDFPLEEDNPINPNLYPITASINLIPPTEEIHIFEADESNNQLTQEIFINLVYEEEILEGEELVQEEDNQSTETVANTEEDAVDIEETLPTQPVVDLAIQEAIEAFQAQQNEEEIPSPSTEESSPPEPVVDLAIQEAIEAFQAQQEESASDTHSMTEEPTILEPEETVEFPSLEEDLKTSAPQNIEDSLQPSQSEELEAEPELDIIPSPTPEDESEITEPQTKMLEDFGKLSPHLLGERAPSQKEITNTETSSAPLIHTKTTTTSTKSKATTLEDIKSKYLRNR